MFVTSQLATVPLSANPGFSFRWSINCSYEMEEVDLSLRILVCRVIFIEIFKRNEAFVEERGQEIEMRRLWTLLAL